MSGEFDIIEIADKIFSQQPQPKFSIQLQFEETNIKDLFEALLMLTTHGMKKLFGTPEGKVNLTELTKKELDRFNKYLHSIGMELHLKTENYNPLKDYESLKYNKIKIQSNTNLLDLKFPMMQPNGLVYIISFDYYRDYS